MDGATTDAIATAAIRMTELPKIVRQRLRAQPPALGQFEHPEADVLTAFAELCLSPAERDGVLRHLALCADCRELLALALPPTTATATITAEAENEPVSNNLSSRTQSYQSAGAKFGWPNLRWPSLRWANLRWAALAAGIAVAVLIVRPSFEHSSKPPVHVAVQAPAPSAQSSPAAHDVSGTSSEASPEKTAEAKPGALGTRDRLASTPMIAQASPEAGLKAPFAGPLKKQSLSASKLATGGAVSTPALNVPKSSSDVEASGAATVPAAASSSDSNLIAQDAAPAIVRAKPAPDDSLNSETEKTTALVSANKARPASQATGMLVARNTASIPATLQTNANWTIKAGVLQRSLDGGQTWQDAARADHALLCYANPNRGPEVWAGGQAGTLVHSSDGGKTWSTILVSSGTAQLTADVTHIDVRSPAEVVLETGNHESWSSTDNGKTWEKK
jgi:hypothetical protein